MTTYSQLLKDPRWQKVRLKKLDAVGWHCERCYDDETMLSVHHKHYVKGRMPWEYPEHELAVLCQPCHEIEHEEKEERSALLASLHMDGPASTGEFFCLGAGYMSMQTNDEVMHAIANQFHSQNPFLFSAGLLVAALDYSRMSLGGFEFMARELRDDATTGFKDEFSALLGKYGLLSEGFKHA